MISSSPNRRDFLKTSALSGAALALGVSCRAEAGAKPEIRNLSAGGAAAPRELTPFVLIDAAGAVTLMNPRPDMGQGTFQSMPALIAEELEISLDAVKIVQTTGAAKYGDQNAGGSSSVRRLWKPLRTAGAAAREMLIAAAAQTWGVPASECYAENGAVKHRASGKTLGYGALVEKASKMDVPKDPPLKNPKDFKILGKPMHRPDTPLKTDGSAQFGLDVKVPGMLYAAIERSPTIHGSVVKFDDSQAKKIAGVRRVVKSERRVFGNAFEGVAVLADSSWAALQGRKALSITWDTAKHENLNTETLYAEMRELAKKDGASAVSRGNFAEAFAKAPKKLEAAYETPFLSHAAMEPLNATAHVKPDGSAEIWAPTQGAGWTVRAVAGYLKIPSEKVVVHPTFLGGGFGRKGGIDDFVLEAVFLSKAVGAPVKVLWTREDDQTQGPFRPGSINVLRGAFDAQGALAALEHKVVAPSIQHQFNPLPADKADDWALDALEPEDSPYAAPNFSLRYNRVGVPFPVMWWRSVYASTNVFGHESFIDELAHAAGKDPLDFRLALLAGAKEPSARRFEAALQTLAEKARLREKPPAGKGRGIAVARSFGSVCAHAVTVGRDAQGKLRVEKVVSVIDCGMHVNTDTVKAQTEGNIIMGLTAALKDPITFKQGRVQQPNFDSYRVLRINETPEMEAFVMPSAEAPGGVGEPGLPPVAPALANAIFAATGKRLRTLPLALETL